MDFEFAAKRLQRDQSSLQGRRKVQLSDRAVQEAHVRKRQQEARTRERAAQLARQEKVNAYMRQCERSLGVQSLATLSNDETTRKSSGVLMLQATSIHGDGDKIALPPSVLETLSQSLSDNVGVTSEQQQQPWTFRIGVLNPNYHFPASPLLLNNASIVSRDDEGDNGDDETDDFTLAYLDELQHKYIAYTHATVVEFTQEEGYIGLPQSIANALLRQQQQQNTGGDAIVMESFRTVDKAASENEETMTVDAEESNTPGHLAWGAFDLPASCLEVTRVRLPKGTAATLRPTAAAVAAGFYNLTNVKLVLEQSLIRTRATLSVGDVISGWHRGAQFELTVTNVTPASYQAISCINTDIEIDFAPQNDNEKNTNEETTSPHPIQPPDSLGRRLNDSSVGPSIAPAQLPQPVAKSLQLLPEPSLEQTKGVVTIQIRGSGINFRHQRRFDTEIATVQDLFAFALSIAQSVNPSDDGNFQLVTRFPRRVLTLNSLEAKRTLEDVGLSGGQELFLIEPLNHA